MLEEISEEDQDKPIIEDRLLDKIEGKEESEKIEALLEFEEDKGEDIKKTLVDENVEIIKSYPINVFLVEMPIRTLSVLKEKGEQIGITQISDTEGDIRIH